LAERATGQVVDTKGSDLTIGQHKAGDGQVTVREGRRLVSRQVSWLPDQRSSAPSQDRRPQWSLADLLPGHSGATAPESHRLPFSAPTVEPPEHPKTYVVFKHAQILWLTPLGPHDLLGHHDR
jgi:hypothetical protein